MVLFLGHPGLGRIDDKVVADKFRLAVEHAVDEKATVLGEEARQGAARILNWTGGREIAESLPQLDAVEERRADRQLGLVLAEELEVVGIQQVVAVIPRAVVGQ